MIYKCFKDKKKNYEISKTIRMKRERYIYTKSLNQTVHYAATKHIYKHYTVTHPYFHSSHNIRIVFLFSFYHFFIFKRLIYYVFVYILCSIIKNQKIKVSKSTHRLKKSWPRPLLSVSFIKNTNVIV